MSQTDDRLADVVNQEPIVFNDCTQGELLGSFLFGISVGLTVGVVIGVAVGFIMFGIVVGLLMALGLAWIAMSWLSHIRQKYYLTWLKEKVFLAKLYVGIGSSVFFNFSKRFVKGARRRV